MNLEKLKSLEGMRVRLRPAATSRTPDGVIEHFDDQWIVDHVDKQAVGLHNISTDHILNLNPDHVHHFTSDVQSHDGLTRGFLELNVRVTLSGPSCSIEPILSGAARSPRWPSPKAWFWFLVGALLSLSSYSRPGAAQQPTLEDHVVKGGLGLEFSYLDHTRLSRCRAGRQPRNRP